MKRRYLVIRQGLVSQLTKKELLKRMNDDTSFWGRRKFFQSINSSFDNIPIGEKDCIIYDIENQKSVVPKFETKVSLE